MAPPSEIARRRPIGLTDIIRSLPGFRIVEGEFGRTIEPTRTGRSQAENCVNVFIDHAMWDLSQPGELDRTMNVGEIAAVETYSGGYVPQEFSAPGTHCAVIVIWTKTKIDER